MRSTASSGELFLYDENLGLAAFEAGGRGNGSAALVCVAGLTDGLLSLRYYPSLAQALPEWRCIQPVMLSSYRGWGQASLDEDVECLDVFLEHLRAERGVKEVVLLGHSTGCQDTVLYMKKGKHRNLVKGIILQAPVSDREAASPSKDLEEARALALTMIKDGHGEEAMPRAASLLSGCPDIVTATRFASLNVRMTEEDMFSSDLSDSELQQRLGHIAVPSLLAFSEDDEYVPNFVNVHILSKRIAQACAIGARGARSVVLQNAGHSLRKQEGQQRFIQEVQSFLSGVASGQLRALSWEPSLAQDLLNRSERRKPLVVALAGMPGSGKSTAAASLQRLLAPHCLVVPLDGFHVPLAQLKTRPDASEAIYRRGAADTFDPALLREALSKLRRGDDHVEFPSFDHAVGDPLPSAIKYDRSVHQIVLVEGLYLLHDADGFQGLSDIFDLKIYLECDLEVCMSRVKERNKVIPGYTLAEIEVRTDLVDRANAVLVQKSATAADVIMRSA